MLQTEIPFEQTKAVLLNSFTWWIDGAHGRFYSSRVDDLKLCEYGRDNPAPNIICPNYKTKNTWYMDATTEDMLISTNNSLDFPRIFIVDHNCSTVEQLISKIQNLYIAYEITN